MQEKYLNMKNSDDFNKLSTAANVVKNGGLVLFPTETVYGIGTNGLDDEAVKKIFLAKGRAQDNPLILHIDNMQMLDMIAKDISDLEYKLMDAFWPGPFTIILNKKENIANTATCNGSTVGVRMPSNKLAHELIKMANVPIAAPSANVSGRPSGTNIQDIFEELKDSVDYIIDGGDCEIGVESTVVKVINNKVDILRPGFITKENIENIISNVEINKNVLAQIDENEKVLSPGMKYRHYAPRTHCILVYSENNNKQIHMVKEIANKYNSPLILSLTENISEYCGINVINIGSKNNLQQILHNLFSILRKIDDANADIAIIEGVKSEGLGLAIMNRLIRACDYNYKFES